MDEADALTKKCFCSGIACMSAACICIRLVYDEVCSSLSDFEKSGLLRLWQKIMCSLFIIGTVFNVIYLVWLWKSVGHLYFQLCPTTFNYSFVKIGEVLCIAALNRAHAIAERSFIWVTLIIDCFIAVLANCSHVEVFVD